MVGLIGTGFVLAPAGGSAAAQTSTGSGAKVVAAPNQVHATASTTLPGWMSTNLSTGAALNGISCPTFETCFAVGTLGNNFSLIERTTNGGGSWLTTTFTNTVNIGGLDAVACHDTTHCVATGGGTSGTAFATTDGISWVQETLPSGTGELTSVTCATDTLCWAISSKGAGVRTANGGQVWTVMNDHTRTGGGQTIDDFGISFPTTTSGWIAGEQPAPCSSSCAGYVQHSSDGGLIWNFQSLPASTPGLVGIDCPSTSECLAVGGGTSGAVEVRTTNGGASWTKVSMPTAMDFAESISCVSTQVCSAVGFGSARYSAAPQLESSDAVAARTTNGGTTWTAQPVEGGLYSLNSVSCATASDCRGVGGNYKGVAVSSTTDGGVPSSPGYWLVASDGGVFAFGSAHFYGSTGGVRLNKPIVGIAADPLTGGYWMVATDGGIFAFNAPFFGSTGGVTLAKPIVAMAVDPVTGGYWMVASDGGIFAFNAPFYGSMGGKPLKAPIVGMAVLGDGGGYFLVGQDGSVYAFGAATYSQCTGNPGFNQKTVGMAMDTDTGGYWLTSTGGELAYCDAPFDGDTATANLERPIVGITSDPATGGYWFDATDGGIFAFDAPFLGSTGGVRLNQPVVGIATVPGG